MLKEQTRDNSYYYNHCAGLFGREQKSLNFVYHISSLTWLPAHATQMQILYGHKCRSCMEWIGKIQYREERALHYFLEMYERAVTS